MFGIFVLKRLKSYLSQVQAGTFGAVVVVSVHMEDLFSFDRQKARKNALRKAGSHDNDVVLLVLSVSDQKPDEGLSRTIFRRN